ncbi:MAG TPA: FtsX-like permease family protein [Steroidobacteraceae bacterium]|nr:FtsX-like permease family protein [Steroidobacteraceae bacterium]
MSLRNLWQRRAATVVSLTGICGVVLVVVAVLAMAEGFRSTLELAGGDDVAIVIRGGSTGEMSSVLSQEDINLIGNAPGIASDAGGQLTSAEFFATVDVAKRSTNTWANVPIRGIESQGAKIRPHFKLISGRMFTPGHSEIVVGIGASRAFAGLELGATLVSGANRWQVVGIFSDAGSVAESEIWTDVRVLQGAYSRGSSFQTARVKLVSPGAFTAFRDALTSDPRLNVTVKTEREYFSDQSRTLTTLIRGAGVMIAILMGAGAVFGALNTMYSAVAARAREIATLRALGFGAAPIIVSVLTEAILIGLVGGLIGGGLAYFAFNGYQASTLNMDSFSQVTFAFAVTPSLLVAGIGYALLLGLAGGLMPAVRAVRQSIVDGLRAL